jgi:hypothetical protein
MNARRRGARLEPRAYVVCIFALGGVSAWSLLSGRPEEAAIGVFCIAAVLARPLFGVMAAVLAALLGAWPVAVLTLLTALLARFRAFAARIPPRRLPPDRDALAAVLAAAPDDLLYATRIRAGSQSLSTWHLLAVARVADPGQWQELLGKDPGEGAWDGPVLDFGEQGTATMFFAEAVGLSAEIALRLGRPVDSNLLAVAATATPLSAADGWNSDPERTTDRVLGIALIDLIDAVTAFSETEAGRDIVRRAQLGEWGKRRRIDDRRVVFELAGTRLARLAIGFLT